MDARQIKRLIGEANFACWVSHDHSECMLEADSNSGRLFFAVRDRQYFKLTRDELDELIQDLQEARTRMAK